MLSHNISQLWMLGNPEKPGSEDPQRPGISGCAESGGSEGSGGSSGGLGGVGVVDNQKSFLAVATLTDGTCY